MAKAYVSDICQFIDIANKENMRILNQADLIWVEVLLHASLTRAAARNKADVWGKKQF